MEMIPRKCSHPLCYQAFMANESDLITKFHAKYCEEDYLYRVKRGFAFHDDARFYEASKIKEQKCLDMVSAEKTEESGMEGGERQSSSREEKPRIESANVPQRSWRPEDKEASEREPILKKENSCLKGSATTTTLIKITSVKEGPSGEEITRKDLMNTRELTIQKTSLPSSQESLKTGLGETHSSASSQLSTALNEEKESSIKTLNESSKLLLNYAKGMMKVREDENGEPLSRPITSDVMTALQCVEAVRNIQKTKLDFLKFAKDLQKGSV